MTFACLCNQCLWNIHEVIFLCFSALEGAESTLIMASGMCASTVMLMALVPAGGHIVTTTDCYRKTRIFIETILPKMGISVWFKICSCYSFVSLHCFLRILVGEMPRVFVQFLFWGHWGNDVEIYFNQNIDELGECSKVYTCPHFFIGFFCYIWEMPMQ